MNSKVCVYCIAKNEAKFVERFMASVKDADLVVVGDTGSTDGTQEKLRALGAVVFDVRVEPWRFDVARNKVIEAVPGECDCLFSIDLDETIETPGWKARLLSAWQGGANRVKYHYTWALRADGTPGKRFTYDKIHSRDFRWVRPCHEVLELQPGKTEKVAFVDIEVVHRPDPTKSRGNYLALLEMAVKESPQDPRMLHYYGRELYYRSEWAKAKEVLRKHAEWEGQWAAERAASCRFMAECAVRLGQYDEADRWYKQGCLLCPGEREPHIAYAKYLQRRQDHAGCYREAEAASRVTTRLNHYLEDRYAWQEGPDDLMGVAAWYLGRREEARVRCQAAAKSNRDDARLSGNAQLFQTGVLRPEGFSKERLSALLRSAADAWRRTPPDMKEARAAFQEAQRLAPSNPDVLANRLWFTEPTFRVDAAALAVARRRIGAFKDAKVSVLLASYCRPEGALRASATARATASRRDLVEVIAATDETDPKARQYAEMPELQSVVLSEHTTSAKWNTLAKRASGDILVFACDDVVFESAGWDQVLRDLWPDDGVAVMYSDAGSGREFLEFPVVSRKMVTRLGFAVPPELVHSKLDSWWSVVGAGLERLYYLGPVWRLRHDHYIRSPVHDRGANTRRGGSRDAELTHPRAIEPVVRGLQELKAGRFVRAETSTEDVQVVVVSCARLDLLDRTLATMRRTLGGTPAGICVYETSGKPEAAYEIKKRHGAYAQVRWSSQPCSLAVAADEAWPRVTAPYLLFCGDDWEFLQSGYIAQTRAILDERADVMIVRWLQEEEARRQGGRGPVRQTASGVAYAEYVPWKCAAGGFWQGWFGPCALQRTPDFARSLGVWRAYSNEIELDAAYGRSGRKTVWLEQSYIRHLGDGRSVAAPRRHDYSWAYAAPVVWNDL